MKCNLYRYREAHARAGVTSGGGESGGGGGGGGGSVPVHGGGVLQGPHFMLKAGPLYNFNPVDP
jgi:hypothetical protein